jgi:rare lipoprotein A
VDVRINDRGPYIGARELDLSYGAATAIGLTNPGVDYVSVTYI